MKEGKKPHPYLDKWERVSSKMGWPAGKWQSEPADASIAIVASITAGHWESLGLGAFTQLQVSYAFLGVR